MKKKRMKPRKENTRNPWASEKNSSQSPMAHAEQNVWNGVQ